MLVKTKRVKVIHGELSQAQLTWSEEAATVASRNRYKKDFEQGLSKDKS